jgi:polyferredoxin
MTPWGFAGGLLLVTWFWVCPWAILAAIAGALKLRAKGKEQREAWERESKGPAGT